MKLPRVVVAVALGAAVAGCGDVNAALGKLAEARRLAAGLQVDFTRAADAANRAVMADTDEASIAYAREADGAKHGIHTDLDALRPLLQSLGYADESQMLHEFEGHFAQYEKLDEEILALAVENSNLKAQRLSFDAARTAADAFRDALEALDTAQGRDVWRQKAAIATAVAAVRDIQALQAPHIAEPQDAPMTEIETRMRADERVAREAVAALAALVDPAAHAKVAAAGSALNHFMEVNAQIVTLSRRNTNVRSLALSLNEKRQLVPPCEQDLRALNDALAHHGLPKGRWE